MEDALAEMEAQLESCRQALAESRQKAFQARARAQTLEEDLNRLRAALRAARTRMAKLEADLAAAQPEGVLNRVAEALARRMKPSFAEDERGLLASFKIGEDVRVLRRRENEKHKEFRARVWREWLAAMVELPSLPGVVGDLDDIPDIEP